MIIPHHPLASQNVLWCQPIQRCDSGQTHPTAWITRSSWTPTISWHSLRKVDTGACVNFVLLTYSLTLKGWRFYCVCCLLFRLLLTIISHKKFISCMEDQNRHSRISINITSINLFIPGEIVDKNIMDWQKKPNKLINNFSSKHQRLTQAKESVRS